MFCSSVFLITQGKSPSTIFYGGDINGSIVTSRSGNAVYRLTTNLLRKEHSEDVALAASVFSKLVNNLCKFSMDDEKLVIAPSDMEFKYSIMNIHAFGEAELSVRFNDLHAFSKIDKQLREKLPKRKYKDILHFSLEGGLRRLPMPETEQNKYFYNFVKNLAKKVDIAITREHRWSSSDICFIDVEKQILDGFGPIGAKHIGKSEYILRHSLQERSLLIALTLNELLKQGSFV